MVVGHFCFLLAQLIIRPYGKQQQVETHNRPRPIAVLVITVINPLTAAAPGQFQLQQQDSDKCIANHHSPFASSGGIATGNGRRLFPSLHSPGSGSSQALLRCSLGEEAPAAAAGAREQ